MAERLMLVSCHPDDELLSSPVLLLDAKRLGVSTYLLWATKGERSVSRQAHTRIEEAAAVAHALAAEHDFLGLPDGSVGRSDVIGAVQRVIESIKPTVVVWPFGVGPEQHQDHRALHEALINICNRSSYAERVFLAGQPPVLDDKEFSPNLFMGHDDQAMRATKELLRIYSSENLKGFFRRDDVEPRASHWARQARLVAPYAEPYQLIKGVPPKAFFPRRHVSVHAAVLAYIEDLESDAQYAVTDLIAGLREEGHLTGYSWRLDDELWCVSQRHSGTVLIMIYAELDDVLILLDGFSSKMTEVPASNLASAKERLLEYNVASRRSA